MNPFFPPDRTLSVLSWNLYHGRSGPPAGRDLFSEFAGALAGWSWDVALLQEVPPWWPAPMAAATDAAAVSALTSRNSLLPLRRAIAVRQPDLIKSNGGGANAILVRRTAGAIAEHRRLPLARVPERRVMHAVRIESVHAGSIWVGNLHATVRDDGAARQEAAAAAAALRSWSTADHEAPAVLGGDFNVHRLALEGFTCAAVNDVDMVFAAGLTSRGAEALKRGELSDHAPVRAQLTGS